MSNYVFKLSIWFILSISRVVYMLQMSKCYNSYQFTIHLVIFALLRLMAIFNNYWNHWFYRFFK